MEPSLQEGGRESMKKVILTLVTASLIIGFIQPNQVYDNSSSEDGLTIQEKHRNGGN
jgi:hypothetical protein